MSKLNKILISVFALLLLIIIAEFVYIFLIPKESITTRTQERKSEGRFIETQKSKTLGRTATMEAAVHPTMLEIIKRYVKSPESSLYILAEQSNIRVLEVERKSACVEDRRNGIVFPGEICFPFAMKLENKSTPNGYIWVFLTENQIKKVKVYKRNNNTLSQARLSDIKVNDRISTVEKWDPSIHFDINFLKDSLDKQMIEYNLYLN